jgi:hypothetical protein
VLTLVMPTAVEGVLLDGGPVEGVLTLVMLTLVMPTVVEGVLTAVAAARSRPCSRWSCSALADERAHAGHAHGGRGRAHGGRGGPVEAMLTLVMLTTETLSPTCRRKRVQTVLFDDKRCNDYSDVSDWNGSFYRCFCG